MAKIAPSKLADESGMEALGLTQNGVDDFVKQSVNITTIYIYIYII